MNRKHVVAFAFSLCVMTGRSWSQPAPMMPAVPDEVPEIESQVPGDIQIVRWDMLLNQAGADAVNKTATPAESKSKVYKAMTCNGFELRQAMADAIANNGVEQFSRNIVFGQQWGGQSLSIPQQMNFNYYGGVANTVRMSGYAQNMQDTFARQPGDHLKISLNDALTNMSIIEKNHATRINSNPSIVYDGVLAAGDAVAFMAPCTAPSKTVYYQLTVWETFKAPTPLVEYMSLERNADWWCRNGPGRLRKWATAASIWESQGAHPADEAPASFVKKLSDGKELKLIGLMRPSDAPWCWWDADGKPVSGVPNYGVSFQGDPPAGLWAAVEVKGTETEYHRESPATQPVQDRYSGMVPGQSYIQYGYVQIDDGATEIKAGALVGPWEEVAQLTLGDEKTIDGFAYKLENAQKQSSNNWALQFNSPTLADKVMAISAVGSGGKEAESFNQQTPIEFASKGNPKFPTLRMYMNFQGMDMADVQYYRLCQRKREFQTFTGFATKSLTPVKTDFTPDDLAAAMKAKQQAIEQEQLKANKESLAQSQAKRKDWDAIKPDLTAPLGMLKTLANAAALDDEKTVRSLMQSTNPGDGPTIDNLAHFLTLAESNWKKANDKFGEEKVVQLTQRNPQFTDFGLQFMQMPWTKSDDGTWAAPADQFVLKKDDQGHYFMDLTGVASQKDATTSIKAMAKMEEPIAKLLDQPNATFDQLTEAVAALQPM